jgi:hypothetical protein
VLGVGAFVRFEILLSVESFPALLDITLQRQLSWRLVSPHVLVQIPASRKGLKIENN